MSADWKCCAEEMPDAERTVIVYLPEDDEPVWFGYFDGEVWRQVDALRFCCAVTHWTDLPEPPAEVATRPASLSTSSMPPAVPRKIPVVAQFAGVTAESR